MKKDRNNIDELFHSKLGHQQFDVPSDFLDDLNQKLDLLDAKGINQLSFFKRYKRMILLLCFIFGSVSVALMFSYKNSTSQKSISSNYTQSENQKALDTTYNSEKIVQNTFLKKNDSENNRSKTKATFLELKTKNNSENLTKEKQSSGLKTLNSQNNSTKTKDKQVKNKKGGLKNTHNLPPEYINNNEKTNELNLTNFNKYNPLESNQVMLKNDIETNLNENDKQNSEDTTLIVSKLDFQNVPLLEEKKQRGLELQFRTGLQSSFSTLKSEQDFLNDFQQQKRSVLTPEIGLLLYFSNNKFDYGTGISFFQQTNKGVFTKTSITNQDSTYISGFEVNYITDSLNVPIDSILTPQYSTVTVQKTNSEDQSYKNIYTWISIPFSFGYRFQTKQLTYTPRIAGVASFGLNNRTLLPNSDNSELIHYAFSKMALSYQVELEIRKEYKNYYFLASPYFRGAFVPVIQQSMFTYSLGSFGVNVGVGIKF